MFRKTFYVLLVCFALCSGLSLKAQEWAYVYDIFPDPVMQTWVMENVTYGSDVIEFVPEAYEDRDYLGRRNLELDGEVHSELREITDLTGIEIFRELNSITLHGLPELTALPDGIWGFYNLDVLDVQLCQNLSRVPLPQPGNYRLEALIIADCNIPWVDTQYFSRLGELVLRNNPNLGGFDILPQGLTVLDVSNTAVNDIRAIGKMPYLSSVYAHNAALDRVPKELPPNLVRITLHNNRLTYLPKLTPLQTVELDLSNNLLDYDDLTYLPPNLEVLNLANNRLQGEVELLDLPPGIRHLNLSGNQIDTLSHATNLASLEELLIDGNLLQTITNLPQGLRLLSAAENQMTTFPPLANATNTAWRYPNLTHLNLEGNPFTTMPPPPGVNSFPFQTFDVRSSNWNANHCDPISQWTSLMGNVFNFIYGGQYFDWIDENCAPQLASVDVGVYEGNFKRDTFEFGEWQSYEVMATPTWTRALIGPEPNLELAVVVERWDGDDWQTIPTHNGGIYFRTVQYPPNPDYRNFLTAPGRYRATVNITNFPEWPTEFVQFEIKPFELTVFANESNLPADRTVELQWYPEADLAAMPTVTELTIYANGEQVFSGGLAPWETATWQNVPVRGNDAGDVLYTVMLRDPEGRVWGHGAAVQSLSSNNSNRNLRVTTDFRGPGGTRVSQSVNQVDTFGKLRESSINAIAFLPNNGGDLFQSQAEFTSGVARFDGAGRPLEQYDAFDESSFTLYNADPEGNTQYRFNRGAENQTVTAYRLVNGQRTTLGEFQVDQLERQAFYAEYMGWSPQVGEIFFDGPFHKTQKGTAFVAGFGGDPAMGPNMSVVLNNDAHNHGTLIFKDKMGRQVLRIQNPIEELVEDMGFVYYEPNSFSLSHMPETWRFFRPSLHTDIMVAAAVIYDTSGRQVAKLPDVALTLSKPTSGILRVAIEGQPAGSSDLEAISTSAITTVQSVLDRTHPMAQVLIYDSYGNRFESYHPDTGITRFYHDILGRLHFQQNARQREQGRATRYLYDQSYRIWKIMEVSAGTIPGNILPPDFAYDFLTPPTPLAGTPVVENRYDRYPLEPQSALWQLTFTHSNHTLYVPRQIQEKAKGNAYGRLTKVSDGSTTKVFFYNQEGQVIYRVTAIGDLEPQTFESIYDPWSGNKERLIYPDGQEVRYQYDALNQLKSVGDSAHPERFASFSYRADGKVAQIRYGQAGNAGTAKYKYDERGRPEDFDLRHAQTGTTVFRQMLNLDNMNNVRGAHIIRGGPLPGTDPLGGRLKTGHYYWYDYLNQLRHEKARWYNQGEPFVDTNHKYQYDRQGRRQFHEHQDTDANVVAADYFYEPDSNRLDQVTGGETWDLDFNSVGAVRELVRDSQTQLFEYDDFRHPTLATAVSFTNGADDIERSESLYDANGSRVRHQLIHGQGRDAIIYTLGGAGQTLSELEVRENGQHLRRTNYIVAGNMRIGRTVSETEFGAVVSSAQDAQFFIKDHLNTNRVILDDLGEVIYWNDEDAFGVNVRAIAGMTTSDGSGTDAYRYTDKRLDAESGLYLNGHRYYLPQLGMFTAPDPLNEYAHAYSYVGNNPLSAVDPTGLASEEVIFEEYVVQEGDTLSGIARDKLGSLNRVGEIADANPQISNTNMIFPGNTLKVPVGDITLPPPAPPVTVDPVPIEEPEVIAADKQSGERLLLWRTIDPDPGVPTGSDALRKTVGDFFGPPSFSQTEKVGKFLQYDSDGNERSPMTHFLMTFTFGAGALGGTAVLENAAVAWMNVTGLQAYLNFRRVRMLQEADQATKPITD